MQNKNLKLQEIIWEITGRCENKCTFCGSKDIWDEEIDDNTIKTIARRIKEFPPEEIDISGGDPLLVSLNTHEWIVDLLKDAGVKCKIVINPKSLFNRDGTRIQWKEDIIDLYDVIGMSINNTKETEKYKCLLNKTDETKRPITIITNFNLQNTFHFDSIARMVKEKDLLWMIQFTVYQTEDPTSLALYDEQNKEALEHLVEKVQKAIGDGVKIIVADNANNGNCTAGMRSLGITSQGDVIPCLSMRSWEKDLDVQGNLLDITDENLWKHKLEDIWINGFKDYRFCDFKCCKDQCNDKQIPLGVPELKFHINTDESSDCITITDPTTIPQPIAVYYAVTGQPPVTFVYGVTGGSGSWSGGSGGMKILYGAPEDMPGQGGSVPIYAVRGDFKDTQTDAAIDMIKKAFKNKDKK